MLKYVPLPVIVKYIFILYLKPNRLNLNERFASLLSANLRDTCFDYWNADSPKERLSGNARDVLGK